MIWAKLNFFKVKLDKMAKKYNPLCVTGPVGSLCDPRNIIIFGSANHLMTIFFRQHTFTVFCFISNLSKCKFCSANDLEVKIHSLKISPHVRYNFHSTVT